MLQGLLVDGLMRVHLCGPACELRARIAADVKPLPDGAGDSVDRADADAESVSFEVASFCCCER